MITAYRRDETLAVADILARADMPGALRQAIQSRAHLLVERTRARGLPGASIEAFLAQYQLTSMEGVALMCLAEALLRTPDAETIDRLITDKIGAADWSQHVGQSPSMFVNASSWALMLTRGVLAPEGEIALWTALRGVVGRLGAPVVRTCALQAIRLLGKQFVMGETIEEALRRARDDEREGWSHSYDMLGEAARTKADAQRYWQLYANAIDALGRAAQGRSITDAPGISIKLSALHPRYEMVQRDRVLRELTDASLKLVQRAAAVGIGVTIDAEESDRLELSLEIFERLAHHPSLKGWQGLGLAVQAYQKRAVHVIDWLSALAKASDRRLMVRLVKGAYWDSEIKRCQERGLEGYPVFTRKMATDVSYIACARALLADPEGFYPQFATHNAHTLATIATIASNRSDYEFQRLHGMGKTLFEAHWDDAAVKRCRIYAPVGPHEDLLPYLVRRLLENGANTSFVNHLHDANSDIAMLIADPAIRLAALPSKPHPGIALPVNLFGTSRENSMGEDMSVPENLDRLQQAARAYTPGKIINATPDDIHRALNVAKSAQPEWDARPVAERAAILEAIADAFQTKMNILVAAIVNEGGRTIPDAISEVREAIDFCRYYAVEAQTKFSTAMILPGPAGEANSLYLCGRGVFACISPWNFPLAIFIGQIAAALVSGNAVLAKPAEETPLIAACAIDICHACGVPRDIVQLIQGDGAIGAALVAQTDIDGVAFTGSTHVAKLIQRALAANDGPIVPLIAETGGLNTMIVDSTALPEQVVADVLASSFNSAGQRCSALRILFIQEDVADRFCTLLKGAMSELVIGDPRDSQTDVGPVISAQAKTNIIAHVAWLDTIGKKIGDCTMPAGLTGHYVSPVAYEIPAMDLLKEEVFGPVLHIIRWKSGDLQNVLDQIRRSGFGLTLGVHSRIDSVIAQVRASAKVGNIYVNRNMIGAVVGSQPFGGEGLSGTGPKAGGPHYLLRFASERCVSIDTTAVGGNASLLCAEEETLITP